MYTDMKVEVKLCGGEQRAWGWVKTERVERSEGTERVGRVKKDHRKDIGGLSWTR